MNGLRLTTITCVAALGLAGCKSSSAPSSMSGTVPQSTQPSGPAPAPGAAPVVASPTPAPTPAPAPVSLTAPAGTAVTIRLNGGLAASRNEVGDHFSGVLERPVNVQGQTLLAAGTAVSGEVVASKGKGRFKGAGDLGIELTAIGGAHVQPSEYEAIGKGRGKRTAEFAGGGAGVQAPLPPLTAKTVTLPAPPASTSGGGTIVLKWMANPWLKRSVLPFVRWGATSFS